jgi:hypothetical protein
MKMKTVRILSAALITAALCTDVSAHPPDSRRGYHPASYDSNLAIIYDSRAGYGSHGAWYGSIYLSSPARYYDRHGSSDHYRHYKGHKRSKHERHRCDHGRGHGRH